jgi:hypothetical protein
MRFSVVALALALLAPVAAHAQDAPPPPPPPPAEAAPPPPPPPPAPPVDAPAPATPATPAAAAPAAPAGPTLNWEAGVDAFYQYNFTGSPNSQAPGFRVFDAKSNSFTLNMAKLATYMNADPVGFRIDLIYGNIGQVGNSVSPLFSAPSTLYSGAIYIAQAYATVKAGIFTLDAGRFYTSASDEVLETHLNWNYSRSLLFAGAPFIHTGLRLGIAVSPILSLQLAILNGWNNDPDNNTNKTFGGQIALTLPSKTNVYLNTYIGNEGTTKDVTMLFDLVVGQTISDTTALSLNADFWKQGDGSWFGVGVKAKLGISDNFYLVPRVEFVSSKKGGYQNDSGFALPTDAMGNVAASVEDASVYEATLTGAFPIGKNYEIRAEFRGDFANKEYFLKGATPKKNQFTGLLGFIAWLP